MAISDQPDAIARYVSGFSRCRVLVLGDAILDEYLLGDCSRISPEAPVPVLKVHADKRALGGAANTAANIVSLGGHATLVTLVGTDQAGLTLRRHATDAGIDLMAVDRGTATLRKTRVIGQHQQIVRLDYEEPVLPSPERDSEVLALFDAALGRCDVVVVSDYAKGLLSLSLARAIIERTHAAGRRVLIDPRPQHRAFYQGCDYLTPNWKESRALLYLPDAEPTPEETSTVAAQLASALDANVVLTLGSQGIRFCSRSRQEQFAQPTAAREVFDVSGAGDTVAAALALSIAAGADHATAVAIANRAASVVVGKFGTATATPEEILGHADAPRLVPRGALSGLSAALRAQGKRIASVTGSFDILHNGHVHALNEARAAGDVVVVGLESDAAIRSSNASDRPYLAEQQRAEMLLALRAVDYVHIIDEPQALSFLEELKPHVHVAPPEVSEHSPQHVVVVRAGGRVHRVEKIAVVSPPDLSRLQSRGA
jgi:D-beta-D-heptose 7-phosphate kinase / D-beta-D-heptose 1-phosphate adenosyltransferase